MKLLVLVSMAGGVLLVALFFGAIDWILNGKRRNKKRTKSKKEAHVILMKNMQKAIEERDKYKQELENLQSAIKKMKESFQETEIKAQNTLKPGKTSKLQPSGEGYESTNPTSLKDVM